MLQKSGLHCHDIFKSIDIAHFKIKRSIFIQVAFCVVFFCTEHRSCLKYTVKHANQHLFVKLRALLQDRRSVEIFQFKEVRTALCAFCSELRCVDFRKSLFIQEIAEAADQTFLDLEFCTFSDISKRDRAHVQFRFQ